jgi:DNA-binding protein H-NS
MTRKANFASMSVDELWEIHEEISKLLEAKILAEKKMLESRLKSLHPRRDRSKGPSSLFAGRSEVCKSG